jgi:hypothetical protein
MLEHLSELKNMSEADLLAASVAAGAALRAAKVAKAPKAELMPLIQTLKAAKAAYKVRDHPMLVLISNDCLNLHPDISMLAYRLPVQLPSGGFTRHCACRNSPETTHQPRTVLRTRRTQKR